MMAPEFDEWDLSALPAYRRRYLEKPISFEEICNLVVLSATILSGGVEQYRDRSKAIPKATRQVIFRVYIDLVACDLLYNAPDGLRGRYWQSPDRGYRATRLVINSLRPKLLGFAEVHPLKGAGSDVGASREEILASLEASSAKVWIRERDESGNSILSMPWPQIIVGRWKANESNAQVNKGMWSRAIVDDQIEIKGALIRPDGAEEIPEHKRDRSCQIHQFGFT